MRSLSSSEQSEIIRLCELHEEKHRLDPYYHRCIVLGSWFVKYDGHADLESEYKTYEYLWNKAIGDPKAPHIPQVIAYFCPLQQWAYLVTELIDPLSPADTSPEAVADALQWLRSVPPPSGLTLGSIGGGRARHALFKNSEAPSSLLSVEALQSYMNRALQGIRLENRPADLDFLDDRLIFTQSDMDKSNFGLDKHNRVCLFDFREVVVLPQSFASYTLGDRVDPFIRSVAEHLEWVDHRNRDSMARAGAVLKMSSGAPLPH